MLQWFHPDKDATVLESEWPKAAGLGSRAAGFWVMVSDEETRNSATTWTPSCLKRDFYPIGSVCMPYMVCHLPSIYPRPMLASIYHTYGSYGYVKEFCECSELNLGCFVKPLVSGCFWETVGTWTKSHAHNGQEDTMTTMTMGSGEAASRVPFSQYRFKMVDVYRKLETVNLMYLYVSMI